MKEKYLKPEISVEVLEAADVLLTSVIVVPTYDKKREKENAYRSFGSFIGSGEAFFD